MSHIDVRVNRVGDPPSFEEVQRPDELVYNLPLEKVAILQGGMASGKASLMLLAELPDGKLAALELSAAHFATVFGILRGACASWGEDL